MSPVSPTHAHTQVLAELKEYATEVDVDFVRKAVRAIGRCAIKVEVRHAVVGIVSLIALHFPQSRSSLSFIIKQISLAELFMNF